MEEIRIAVMDLRIRLVLEHADDFKLVKNYFESDIEFFYTIPKLIFDYSHSD